MTFNGYLEPGKSRHLRRRCQPLTNIIVGDLPNVSVRNKGTVTTVDDITISAELGKIDGLYGILGQAGPTSIRTGS